MAADSPPSRGGRRAGRVVAVVVSHDRRDLLQAGLTAVQHQSRAPDAVVVVDNASTDGSGEMVRERFPWVDLVALPRNTGGAGGFAAGLAHALQAHDAELVWLMDDDTIPAPDALAELLACRAGHPGRPALVASRVLWRDGRDHPMNTPRRRPWASTAEIRAAAAVDAVPVRSASFVSVLVDARAARRTGLPPAGYFLWNDDFEFTTRLLRHRVGLAAGRSVVEHRTPRFGSTGSDPGARFYYEVRNKTWLLARGKGLGPMERIVYSGATARRWAHAVLGSSRRPVVLGAGVRGLLDGVRTRPVATADCLAGLGQISAQVEAVDGARAT
jgi:rhamnopyranosyl-N-acetylglucosaminyl-diphospho-decaprenol beta-1,3/1,4-galactofuranosyltransferase